MKVKAIFLFFILVCFISLANGQSISARMEYIFIDNENEGRYSGGIDIKDGQLKINDIISVTDDANNTSKLKVLSIKDYDTDLDTKVLAKGKSGFITVQTIDGKKIPKIDGGFTFGDEPAIVTKSTYPDEITTSLLDGREWKGISYYKSSSYFPNGNSLVNTKNPYLIISFKSTQKPDDRQLTMIHKEAKVGVGILDTKNFEFVLSGSSDGIPENACMVSNWKNGAANTEKTDFYFEITKFDDKGDHIILSARYSGKIFGLNLFSTLIEAPCKDVVIKNGEIKDLKVSKY